MKRTMAARDVVQLLVNGAIVLGGSMMLVDVPLLEAFREPTRPEPPRPDPPVRLNRRARRRMAAAAR